MVWLNVTSEGDYLGCLQQGAPPDSSDIIDSLDTVFGKLDHGKADLAYGDGTTVAEVDNTGSLKVRHDLPP